MARPARDKVVPDVWHQDRKKKVVLKMSSDQFYCSKSGGIKDHEGQLIVLEGTAESGPWYNAFQFSDDQIEKWSFAGWIRFIEKDVV